MTTKLVTLKTNHTILAEIKFVNQNEVVIKKPVQVVMQPSKEGPVMGFVPFLDYSNEFESGVTLNMSDVLCITTPIRELENQYNSVFGSGIQIASSFPKL